MGLTIKSLLDSSLTLNFRSQFVVTLYRLYEVYKVRNLDTIKELCDIFEILTHFC